MKLRGLRWYIIGLIGMATIINYIDRSAINIMWPYIYKDFDIADKDNKEALALVTTFFMIAYALGQTFTGKLMDAIGTRLGFIVSIAGWSISIALHALARTIYSFGIFRFFLGFFEAGNWPGATKSNAEWFPAKERAIAQGIFGAGASLGSVVAAPFIAMLYLNQGWKATFVVIAVLGFLWIIPWLIINRGAPVNPPTDRNNETEIKVYTWKELLRFRNTWGIISSRFFIDPVWWMFVTWLPTFLKEQFGFDIKHVAAFAWLPYLFAAIGGLSGGFFSSWQIRKGIPAHKARKNAITIGALLMLASLSATAFYLQDLKENVPFALGLISITLFGFQFLINNLQTLPSDYFNGKNVGTVAGMSGTSAVLGTLLMIWTVPAIIRTGYVSFFIMGAAMVPLGWFCIRFITSKNQLNHESKK